MKILLKIAYDGAGFCGFQFQPGKRTVQGILTESFSVLYGFDVAVTGCSRTDSGVHALGFCITLEDKSGKNNIMKIPLDKICRAANSILPRDVAVLDAAFADDCFHPRYSASGKEYVYKIYDSAVPSPFFRGRAMYLPGRLGEGQIELMNRAAAGFCGKHDFTSFMASGSKITDPQRTVYSASVSRDSGGFISFSVAADGFLYNMVRIMTGTLLDAARGRTAPEDILKIIEKKDRSAAGSTVVPDGLYLKNVMYPIEIKWISNQL